MFLFSIIKSFDQFEPIKQEYNKLNLIILEK